jgi:hypothetical protein
MGCAECDKHSLVASGREVLVALSEEAPLDRKTQVCCDHLLISVTTEIFFAYPLPLGPRRNISALINGG